MRQDNIGHQSRRRALRISLMRGHRTCKLHRSVVVSDREHSMRRGSSYLAFPGIDGPSTYFKAADALQMQLVSGLCVWSRKNIYGEREKSQMARTESAGSN